MFRIDQFLLRQVQRLSDWIHNWTGIDSVIQSRICSGLMVVPITIAATQLTWLLVLAGVCLGRCCFDVFALDVRRAISKGFKNPRQLNPGYICGRLGIIALSLIVLFSPHDLLSTLLLCSSVEAALMEYFIACDVQTPKPGKIKEALRKMRYQLKPIGSAA